ncbi:MULTISPECIES: UDP-N-acetylmuramoyl-tripeptide--D-alanyl-D-alanine ligase [Trichocoleus]|uniref:UDP-N-acetylmuramoyl-tripeptide--D-alanyl-D-alanine ligase n=1 Tax=Trichocoleus desertorum GB2-A4 TaxID=2933944 RepID=A0ABV0JDC2_9CYAN|nr:UDP-N-acetylmuramoyl-tripeptide--D-alanyl-D-alanine ligase [Trichocoleus sp. FACHB-46]MBD1860812.1 UDP-N-acetylmuramoyl-tripeptide--D-alanyl-D-alanine ligase [Trichocoleus sp. FACHB-46]
MPCRATLSQLVEILYAIPLNLSSADLAQQAVGIGTDTRSLQPGEVFVALRGEKFDGHGFVGAALDQGAIAAIVDQAYEETPPRENTGAFPLLQVTDTLQAYQAIARWWRDQCGIPVVAVTGSVGKTTTKELISAVLATRGRVLKTQANYNNEVGVPKTLLELEPDHDYAVIEMGMRGPGEIALLAQIARPDIAVITNVGTAHIGRLGSEEAIAQAKCELLAEMAPTGTAILNHDSPLLLPTAATVWSGKTISYGLAGGDFQGQLLDASTLSVEGMQFPLPLPGQHNALNYLAALAVAKSLNISWQPLQASLAVELPSGRAKRHELPNDVVLLDETYNAGLESMIAALQLLAQTPGQRRIAVLGTMKELGERSPEFHQQVGAMAAQLRLDHLLILADPEESAAMAAGAVGIATEEFDGSEAVVERLKQLVQPGDRLLFKASRAVALDRVVDSFCQEFSAGSLSQ